MQRWFFADEIEECIRQPTPVVTPDTPRSVTPAASGHFQRYWDFRVCVPDSMKLWPNECLGVVGDCDSLGMWQFERCLRMTRHKTQKNQWRALDVQVPRYHPINYRYLVMAVDEQTQQQIVRRWEISKQPRVVPPDVIGTTPPLPHCRDVFGSFMDGEMKSAVARGWLTSETIVQFKFYKAPFHFLKATPERRLNVRVTPMRMLDNDDSNSEEGEEEEERPSCTNHGVQYAPLDRDGVTGGEELDGKWSTSFAFSEAVVLQTDSLELQPQPRYGNVCGPDDLLLVHCTIGDFERTAYRIDLYTYSSKAAADEPPYAFGYAYALPYALWPRASKRLNLTMYCATKHRPLGHLTVEYLVVRPAEPPLLLPMNASYSRRWQSRYTALDIGHRGCGRTYLGAEGVVRENTIQSLKLAMESGADLVEMDVQVTYDLVPILHHEFTVLITERWKLPELNATGQPIGSLTYEDVKTLRTSQLDEGLYYYDSCMPAGETVEQQPFPRLEEALQAIDQYVGVNIEVKWPQKLLHGEGFECALPADLDKNRAIDAILAVVWQHAGARRIVFSSFDADTCTMLRYKQNRYPVMMLFDGDEPDRLIYADPRSCDVTAAACNARAHELLGIVNWAYELLDDPHRIRFLHSLDLILFCYGDNMLGAEDIQQLKSWGLHGIIYDHIVELITKPFPRSVFMEAATRDLPCQYQTNGSGDQVNNAPNEN